MRLICLLFLAGLAHGILGKAVTVSDDEDFDFDVLRERRSPDFDDEDEDDLSDDYDGFYEHREKSVPSSDYSVPYEFPVSESSLRAADAASDLKGLGAGLKAIQAKLAQISKEVAGLVAKAAKASTDLAKAQAAAKAATAKAAAAKAAAAKKPAAKTAAAASKTVSYNVVLRFPQEVFNPKLQVTTSKEYQTLGKKLQDAVVALYNAKAKELLGFKVNKFTSGSVVADLALKFDASVKDPLKKLKDLIKKGKFAGLVVDPSFLKVYNAKGIICSGACPSCASTACPAVSPYPAPVPAPAPVMYPAPAPVYAPAAPVVCPAACPVSCCAPQPVCPAGCAPACCVNQGR